MQPSIQKIRNFLFVFCFFISLVSAQNFDYHREESPAISWNGVVLYDARLLASGGVSFFSASPFAAICNPALISVNGNLAIGGSFESMNYQAYQYWGVNEGVLKAPEGLEDIHSQISCFSLTLPIKSFCISFGWYVSDILKFPDFDQEDYYWGYSGEYNGQVNNFFMAVAIGLGKGFHAGLSLEYSDGRRRIDMVEHFYFEGGYFITIEQQEFHQSRTIQSSLGLVYQLSDQWRIGAVLDYPLYGEVDRTLTRKFENNFFFPSIVDQQTGTDDFYWPGKILLGASFLPLNSKAAGSDKKIILAAEAMVVFWSQYQYTFFSEEIEREMRNTLIFALGMEYGSFQEKFDYFLRIGYRLDPQPVVNPAVTLHGFSGGLGCRWKRFSGDLGFVYYTGSASDVRQNHLVLCCTFAFRLKGD